MNAKTIKISEFINGNGEFNHKKFTENLEIKKYLSIHTKNILINGFHDNESDIDGIVDRCVIVDNNGYFIVDYFAKEVVLDLTLIKHYSNLELDIDNVVVNEKEIGIYDYIVENGVVEYIKSNILKVELISFLNFLGDCIQNKLNSENSIEASVVKFKNEILNRADTLINKLPDEKGIKKIINEAKNAINKIKPEQIDRLRDAFDLKQQIG